MQVSTTNDVKIYNLSAGKSLPEWLTERKRRQLVKDDIDVRKRIELIQVNYILYRIIKNTKYICRILRCLLSVTG